uniref:Uncharacterized protein n=1 Tax=Anopheles dirus TaxID=7168 RepID=A0A182NVC9_9DIPT
MTTEEQLPNGISVTRKQKVSQCCEIIDDEDNNITAANSKATVHINGVAVDHFHQNSDVDEERRSLCQNSDVHGFISYSSDSSMIELNLKFRKCACNENLINISKENLQQMQRDSPTGAATLVASASDDAAAHTIPTADGVFHKEGKHKKLLALNKDNLNSLVRKLNDTTNGTAGSSCTKCRLSLDVKHILKQIVSVKQTVGDGTIVDTHSPGGDDSCSHRSALPQTIDDSPLGLLADDSLMGSSVASPLPSPNSPIPVLGSLERRHSETVERRSIGTQHTYGRQHYRKKPPLLRGHCRSTAQTEAEIIIISDEFRRQSLRDQQSVQVRKSPKKISKSMESIDKRNPLSLNTPLRSVAIRSFQLPITSTCEPADEMLTIVLNADVLAPKMVTPSPPTVKSISKSVDDMSLGSPVQAGKELSTSHPKASNGSGDDVELVFISDDFVKRKSKSSTDVIIVEGASGRRRESGSRRKKSAKTLSVAGAEAPGSVEKRKLSISATTANTTRASSTEGRIVKSATIPVVPSSSPGAKTKHAHRKTTISNSNSFLTYEEPFSPETLESKDIGQLFAEASIE